MDVINKPGVKLKIIFLLHFLFISWSTLGLWSHHALIIHNLLLLCLLILDISNTDSEELVGLTIVINVISVILDVIILCVYYPGVEKGRAEEFSAIIAVFHLLFRFISSYQLYNEWLERGGLITLHMLNKASSGSGQNNEDEVLHGGSVRCGSLLEHVPTDEYEYSENLYTKNLKMLEQSQNIGIDFEDEETYR